MSREIKFRAWDKLNGRMTSTNIGVDFIRNTVHLFDEEFRGNPTMINDFILLQFTGLKDKNGKEIYEGDIVNCVDTNPTILEVKFIEGGFCCTSSNILPFDINSFYPSIGCRIEVIGNIYENPELLEMQE